MCSVGDQGNSKRKGPQEEGAGHSRKQKPIRIAAHGERVWGVEGHEVRKVGKGQIPQGLTCGSKGFRINSSK